MSAEAALKIVDEVESKALSIVDQARAVTVTDSETYTVAGALWSSIGDMIKEVKATFDPICDAAHKAHKAATAKRAQYLDPLEKAAKDVKRLMSDYDAEQERIRKAEEARLAEIARREEEERRAAELAALEAERKAEEDRLLAAALEADAAGNKEQAEEIMQIAEERTQEAAATAAQIQAEPVYVPPVVVPKAVPKVTGLSYREVWAAEVTDIKALCLAVAQGRASTECVMGNMPVLNKMAVALKSTMNVPGVKSYSRRV